MCPSSVIRDYNSRLFDLESDGENIHCYFSVHIKDLLFRYGEDLQLCQFDEE